jgi:cell division protein ZapE
MQDLWQELTAGGPYESADIKVKGRVLHAAETARGCARFTFAELCEKPLGAEDYLALAQKFDVIFLSVVPRFTYDRRNEGKRFMTLVDVLYDKGVALILAAQALPDKLYHEDTHAFEFQRTASRLTEMQGQDYLKKALG